MSQDDKFNPFGQEESRVRLVSERDAKLLSKEPQPLKATHPVTIDHDSPEQVELRKGQGDPLIMYLIVRESLGMTAGKIAAQCGHATDMVLLKYLYEGGQLPPEDGSLAPDPGPVAENLYVPAEDPATGERVLIRAITSERAARHARYYKWLQTSFRKVVLTADDKEWGKVIHEALNGDSDLCKFVTVRDAGLTEVAAGSETVMALWPIHKSQAPKVIKKLQALK